MSISIIYKYGSMNGPWSSINVIFLMMMEIANNSKIHVSSHQLVFIYYIYIYMLKKILTAVIISAWVAAVAFWIYSLVSINNQYEETNAELANIKENTSNLQEQYEDKINENENTIDELQGLLDDYWIIEEVTTINDLIEEEKETKVVLPASNSQPKATTAITSDFWTQPLQPGWNYWSNTEQLNAFAHSNMVSHTVPAGTTSMTIGLKKYCSIYWISKTTLWR